MCGRFALYSDPFTLARRFEADAHPELSPRYNVAPSQNIPIVRDEGEKRRFALARWGLIPHWAKDMKIGYSTINARAETVASKPAFRNAFRHRRCLIPADGFYEWQVIPGSKIKQPWFIVLVDREPMAFAGLWERWRSPEGEELESCSIIVTEANEIMRPIHDRMPVILAPCDWDAWLEPDAKDAGGLQGLLKPYSAEGMAAWPVSTKVNSPRNDSVECLESIK
jgi:putative SOS response-associated peptidase YedK